ncbi:thiosulfate sulfurtransferase GlpE [Thalassotalea sp. HSM 43]|uniref:thiosulfate sulfurtransferase GlpE n=1 Tax=unclassified Thalassotalea TaxID=2614972 RepID=UPI001080EF76|nr:thiosulfate sulfurtransferase GlpE [Thalassotalea sp. HSM 43]NMP16033.1 thiosulfate sulfurtransferase GlpE [Thalassotalea sp. Y01]QBY04034.1 thiosulfate sulfurtransferase GlpE [Thalassotalea sp. HSM 43]
MHGEQSSFKHLHIDDVYNTLDTDKFVIVDIRDPQSFTNGRIPGAIQLSNENLGDFLRDADFDAPTVVCCYHGISSQQAAQFLIGHDFSDVYSLDGGFDLWSRSYPDKVER